MKNVLIGIVAGLSFAAAMWFYYAAPVEGPENLSYGITDEERCSSAYMRAVSFAANLEKAGLECLDAVRAGQDCNDDIEQAKRNIYNLEPEMKRCIALGYEDRMAGSFLASSGKVVAQLAQAISEERGRQR